ncbi:ABC transporter substrate-binding protein [Lysinibacillus sp. 2017]|uniref:peptide ABC transporter substrate-binding protein n=1 Tax=unclassified Lysinibacillus TaxID=2636778 RepID=UPI000D5276CF|nr:MULTISPECIES: peptide ABC transporter substrate-binding protein [unclassified Lysinibacillus]AWE08773.1 ABC transporter substrate-binding protein [Lysinibacillus sp. 2017]TGN36096.1 peptide ABC transporter substrate-binding protein [Lysinibacillus sp. S2017]
MKFNKFLTLMMVLVLSVVLAACGEDDSKKDDTSEGTTETGTEGTTESTDTTSEPKELNLLFGSEPPSLHPGLATDTTSATVIQNIFEGLMTMENGVATEAAAESYDVSDDLLTYTFKLRDAKWTNGDPVTAEDFAYSWKWALDPVNASEYASILYAIKGAEAYNLGSGSVDDLGIKVIDEKTIEVTLEVPTPYFLELTAFKTMYPVHRATQEANANWFAEADSIVSNGAYTLSEWVHSGNLVLTKSDSYWDAENVKIDTVNIAIVEAESSQMNMFDNDEIDFLGTNFGSIALDAIDRLKSEGSLNVEPYSGIYWYKFNTTDKVISNVNIRKALALSIDRAGLIKNITKGEQEPALGIVPNAVEGFGNDEGYFKDADYATAKEYLTKGLKELGLSDPSELEITVSHNTSEAHAAIAQFIQQGWTKELGIKVKLDNAEWQVYLDKLSNLDYQVGRMGWIADYNDSYTFLEMYNTAANGNNDTGWENKDYTALLKQSVIETDPAKRIATLLEAEAIMMDEMPVAPIYFYTNLYISKDYVSGMVPDGLGNISLKNVDINK